MQILTQDASVKMKQYNRRGRGKAQVHIFVNLFHGFSLTACEEEYAAISCGHINPCPDICPHLRLAKEAGVLQDVVKGNKNFILCLCS